MQVTRITEIPATRINTQKEPITTEKLQREFDYYRSFKLLRKMLQVDLISGEEFDKIDRLNRLSFLPFCAEIMP